MKVDFNIKRQEYSYCSKGVRATHTSNWQLNNRTNVIGDLIGKKLLTVCLFDYSISIDVFEC